MIVSHAKKLVYLAPPKTGSSSLRTLLRDEPFNGEIVGGHEHHGVEWSPALANYFHFITVRHPYPRMFSLYRMICNGRKLYKANPVTWVDYKWAFRWFPHRKPTFEEYLAKKALPFRREWRCSWNLEQLGKSVDVTVVKLENFYEDLRHVKHVNCHIDQIGHVNKRRDAGPSWWEAITPARARRIQRLWPEDFVRFGYNRELKSVTLLGT